MTMTPRERVLSVLNHELPDRVPIILGASNATGIKTRPYRGLKKLLGITSADRYLYDWPELGSIHCDEAVLERLHSDVRPVLDAHPQAQWREMKNREPGTPCFDSWGIGQVELGPGDWFPHINPLAGATTVAELDAYDWPDMDDPSRVAHVRAQAARLAADNRYAIMATPWLLFPLERAIGMQGLENFMTNLVLEPEFAAELVSRCAEQCKRLMAHFLRELDGNADIIKIGDDLGTQTSLMMSPAMYRQLIKPVHADYIAFIRARTDAKLFFHSDGDIFPLIDDFIEMGVDILNPIQTSAGKLADLPELKRRYGGKIIFCGGIDTQNILPHGSPAAVREEVKRVIGILGAGGGYMLGAVHTIMNDVPAENVLAMVDTALEFGRYG
jgi:uroporphyrinogen decarboxylase